MAPSSNAVLHSLEPAAPLSRDVGPRSPLVTARAPDAQGCEEAARYIAQMSGELAAMARSSKLELLAYFLDMARIEATTRSRRPGEPDRA